MSDHEEELSKEERLEAARKKFEELKKKNKKNKKSTKKKASSTTTTGDGDDEGTPTPEDQEDPNLKDDQSITEEQQSPAVDDIEPVVETSPVPEVEKEVVDQEQPTNDNQEESSLEKILSDEAIEPESTFLTDTLKSQIESLTSQLATANLTIKKLQEENTDLKLTKMDLNLELESIKEELQELKSSTSSTNNNNNNNMTKSSSKVSKYQTVNSNLILDDGDDNDYDSFQSPIQKDEKSTRPQFNNFNSFSNNFSQSDDYLDIVDVRERLLHWKDWNVDMRGWRSVGTGPLLEL